MVRSALYNRDIHKVFEHLTFCLGEQGPLHRGGNWWEKEREHHKCCWESHTNHSAENILSFNCHNALWSRYYHTYFISDSQDLTNSHKVPKLVREEPGFPSSPFPQKAGPSAYSSHRWRESKLIFLYNKNLKLSENILCDINYELPKTTQIISLEKWGVEVICGYLTEPQSGKSSRVSRGTGLSPASTTDKADPPSPPLSQAAFCCLFSVVFVILSLQTIPCFSIKTTGVATRSLVTSPSGNPRRLTGSSSVSCLVTSDSLQLHRLGSSRLLCPWNSPGKSTAVHSHSLLQGIFLTQGSNLGNPALQTDSLPSESPGKPRRLTSTSKSHFQVPGRGNRSGLAWVNCV